MKIVAGEVSGHPVRRVIGKARCEVHEVMLESVPRPVCCAGYRDCARLRGVLPAGGCCRPMSRLDDLRRIAEFVGIAVRHVDALGEVHEPDEETLARLIAALGLPAVAGATHRKPPGVILWSQSRASGD